MKIAAITITLNDDFKFKEWFEHYNEYKDELYMHIVVDNGSSFQYLSQVKQFFKSSVIVERATNGGCTAAYNDGLSIALKDSNVDSILLIGNDIKLPKGNLTELHRYLYSNATLGMVSPILLKKDSTKVENYGCILSPTYNMKLLNSGEDISIVQDWDRIVELLPGGMNLAKREFYERVGLQDENLFMYCDEPDIYKRAKRNGFKMGVTKKAVAWHQHINPNNASKRNPYASLLISRNNVYIIKKHERKLKAVFLLIYLFMLLTFRALFSSREDRVYYRASYKGYFRGLMNNMDNGFIV